MRQFLDMKSGIHRISSIVRRWRFVVIGPVWQDTASCADVYTWTTVGAPFVTTWCTPCHSPELLDTADRQGAPVHVVIDSPETVQQWALVIEAVMWSEDEEVRMSHGGGPTAEELTAFQAWLDCGAPESFGLPSLRPPGSFFRFSTGSGACQTRFSLQALDAFDQPRRSRKTAFFTLLLCVHQRVGGILRLSDDHFDHRLVHVDVCQADGIVHS